MLVRKLITFFISIFLFPIFLSPLLMIVSSDWYFFEVTVIVFLFSAPLILIFGMPISALSDFILENQKGKIRLQRAFAIHSLMGLFFGIILSFVLESDFYMFATTLASFTVWSIDELIRMLQTRRGK
jgi:hypothetical protein